MAASSKQIRGIALFSLVLLALVGLILFQVFRPQPPAIVLDTATPLPSPQPTSTPPPLRVYVSGAVRHPDVYTLLPGSIVKDALLAAGGAAEDADLDRINLAQSVADEQHIHVPRQGESNLSPPPLSGPAAEEPRVNINTADATALEVLPGIGPSLAGRIVAYRQANGPFARIEDISNVSGIGPATFAKIRDLITTN